MTGTSAPDQGGKRHRIATLYAPESGTEQGEDLILQGNNDIRHLIDPRHFTSDSIILRASRLDHIRAIGLNSFDLVINAVSDVDLNPEGLELAATICGELDVPVLNLPGAVMDTARDRIAEKLTGIDGLHITKTLRLQGSAITAASHYLGGMGWPVLVRKAGNHGAIDLVRYDDAAALATVLERADYDADDFYYMTEFVDFSEPSGIYWKTRIVVIDGEPVIRHHIPSPEWIVNMSRRKLLVEKRPDLMEREARVVNDPLTFLGEAGLRTIRAIHRAIGLDYFGIDCTVLGDGRLMVFEANASMNMLPLPEKPPDYSVNALRRITSRITRMLQARIAGHAARIGLT